MNTPGRGGQEIDGPALSNICRHESGAPSLFFTFPFIDCIWTANAFVTTLIALISIDLDCALDPISTVKPMERCNNWRRRVNGSLATAQAASPTSCAGNPNQLIFRDTPHTSTAQRSSRTSRYLLTIIQS